MRHVAVRKVLGIKRFSCFVFSRYGEDNEGQSESNTQGGLRSPREGCAEEAPEKPNLRKRDVISQTM